MAASRGAPESLYGAQRAQFQGICETEWVTTAFPSDAEAIAAACARYGVRRVRVFGSALADSVDPGHSDVDSLVGCLQVGCAGQSTKQRQQRRIIADYRGER
ncbi:hypothetical protein GCM10009624_19390 [Gordonia sinesedis]